MADIFKKSKRSQIMSKIKGKDSKPELKLRSALHKRGYRFRLHRKDLPGKPDICLPMYKTVIFMHGCYWHRHSDCNKGKSTPSTNTEFWKKKFETNQERDIKNRKDLEKLGWFVITLWECELKNIDSTINRIDTLLINRLGEISDETQ